MLEEYIVGLVQYLNHNGYSVTSESISRFFKMMADNDIDFSNEEDVTTLMKIVFCNSRVQHENFNSYFNDYVHNKANLSMIKDIESQKEINQKEFTNTQKTAKEELQNILHNINSTEEAIKDDSDEVDILSSDDKDFLYENYSVIKKIKFKDKRFKLFMAGIDEEDWAKVSSFSSDFYFGFAKGISVINNEAIKSNNIEKYNVYQPLYSIVKKLQKFSEGQSKDVNKKIKAETKALEIERKRLEEKIKKEEIQHLKNQATLDSKIQSLKKDSKNIIKNSSVMNRDVFIGGRNCVVALDAPECIVKNFEELSKMEYATIYRYIKKNLLKFKTKMSRNIHTKNKNIVNIKDTIQSACKTGGMPLHICYEKPKNNKTKLLLVLDISGSCSNASKMMLTFMYLLKNVFPGGCKTYAFVDSLYDISDIMNTNNIHESVNSVMNSIPRHGVYSNYYEPIKDLWENHKLDITSDTIVIFMGDARNNNNSTGVSYVKNIARKAKKAYWLNTENFDRWGDGDSIAYKYAKYFKMYETINTNQLLNFIENI